MTTMRLILEHDGEQVLEGAFVRGPGEKEMVDETLSALAMGACEKGLRIGQVKITQQEEGGPVLHEFAVHELMLFWENAVVTLARFEGGLLDEEA